MLLFTIGVIFLLFLISYRIFDRDLFAPPTLVCLSFVFCSLCTFYNEKTWGLDFSIETTWVLFTGLGVFILGGIIAVFLSNIGGARNLTLSFSHKTYPVQYINISRFILFAVIVFQTLIVIWIYRFMVQNVGYVGLSWNEIMSIFRHQTMALQTSPEQITMRMPSLLRHGADLSVSLAIFFSYIVGNNLAVNKKLNFLYWCPVVLGTLAVFMQGYRGAMFRFFAVIVVVWYTQTKRSVGWKYSKKTDKMLKKMAALVLTFAVIFVATRAFVGRHGKDLELDPFYYFTFYAGCSVAALDLYVKDPLYNTDIWGKETFFYLYQGLAAWFNRPELRYNLPQEWRQTPNGSYVGNVYTCFRSPMADFGYEGMLVFMLLMGCFFTFLYCLSRNKHGTQKVDFLLLVYAICAHSFFLYFFSTFYPFISFGFIKTIVILYVLRKIATGKYVISFGGRKI